MIDILMPRGSAECVWETATGPYRNISDPNVA